MKEVHILLVEDNEGDVVLTKEAFDVAGIRNNISVARDGEQALDFLYKRNDFLDAKQPDLILLDINLPKINGNEVLSVIKHDSGLKTIPVIMLTTSSAEKDIMNAYKNYVNYYIVKPISLTKFMGAIKEIGNFWFSLVTIPGK